jgi:Zn-dependent protease
VILQDPGQTPYDLRWRMFGTPVRVHPLFWLMTAILGWDWFNAKPGQGLQLLFLWVVCVFVSILIHELGHVLIGRVFGTHAHIVLYSFGGLAIPDRRLSNRWQRIAVALAGPAAQFLPLGIAWYLKRRYFDLFPIDFIMTNRGELLWYTLGMLYVINLYWPLLNLLPIWPLDGGQVSRDLLDWLLPGRGIRVSLGISLVVSGAIAVNALAAHTGHPLVRFLPAGGLFTALLFGTLALSNYQELQHTQAKPWRVSADDRASWERDPDYWKR